MLRAMLLGVTVLCLGSGCCGEPSPNLVFLSGDSLKLLERLRAEANVTSNRGLIDIATNLHRRTLERQHGLREDDCLADPVDAGAWRVILCKGARECGQHDKRCCRSSVRPPCDPGLTCGPLDDTDPRRDYAETGVCRPAPPT